MNEEGEDDHSSLGLDLRIGISKVGSWSSLAVVLIGGDLGGDPCNDTDCGEEEEEGSNRW